MPINPHSPATKATTPLADDKVVVDRDGFKTMDAGVLVGETPVTATGETVARSSVDRWAEANGVNVKGHGAKGDGVTDDTAAVSAALTLAASGSKVVFFPPGTYLISTITVPRNVSLCGVSAYSSVIKAKEEVPILVQFGSAGVIDEFARCDRLKIDGDAKAQVCVKMIAPQEGSGMSECWVKGATVTAVIFDGTGVAGSSHQSVISRCWIWTRGAENVLGLDLIGGTISIDRTTVVAAEALTKQAGSIGIRITDGVLVCDSLNTESFETGLAVVRSFVNCRLFTCSTTVVGVSIAEDQGGRPVFLQTMSCYTDANDLVDNTTSFSNTHRNCKGYKSGNLASLQDFFFAQAIDKRLDFYNSETNRFVAGFSTPTGATSDFRFTMLKSNEGGWVDSFRILQDSGCCGPNAHAWDQPHLIIGSYHLWVDSSGNLRIKGGVPESGTDGTVVGSQT